MHQLILRSRSPGCQGWAGIAEGWLCSASFWVQMHRGLSNLSLPSHNKLVLCICRRSPGFRVSQRTLFFPTCALSRENLFVSLSWKVESSHSCHQCRGHCHQPPVLFMCGTPFLRSPRTNTVCTACHHRSPLVMWLCSHTHMSLTSPPHTG